MERDSLRGQIDTVIASKETIRSTGNAQSFLRAPDNIYAHCIEISNGIYGFASQFEGHEENNLVEEGNYIDSLTLPIEDFLDFFAAADQIWNGTEAELRVTSKLNIIKRHRLTNLKESVGEDAELARMVGKLEGSIKAERRAEASEDDAVLTFGYTASGPSMGQAGAVIGMGEAEDSENEAEDIRVEQTNQILNNMRPILELFNLREPIEVWINFSNPE